MASHDHVVPETTGPTRGVRREDLVGGDLETPRISEFSLNDPPKFLVQMMETGPAMTPSANELFSIHFDDNIESSNLTELYEPTFAELNSFSSNFDDIMEYIENPNLLIKDLTLPILRVESVDNNLPTPEVRFAGADRPLQFSTAPLTSACPDPMTICGPLTDKEVIPSTMNEIDLSCGAIIDHDYTMRQEEEEEDDISVLSEFLLNVGSGDDAMNFEGVPGFSSLVDDVAKQDIQCVANGQPVIIISCEPGMALQAAPQIAISRTGRPIIKDDAYWNRRQKNNEACRKSRAKRRMTKKQNASERQRLEQRNEELRHTLTSLERQTTEMRSKLLQLFSNK